MTLARLGWTGSLLDCNPRKLAEGSGFMFAGGHRAEEKERARGEGRQAGKVGLLFSCNVKLKKPLLSRNEWMETPTLPQNTGLIITEKLFFSGMRVRMHFQRDSLISGSTARGVRKVAGGKD